MENQKDINTLRNLVKQYLEIANLEIQDERRQQWTSLNSLQMQKPQVLATYGMFNVWCGKSFADEKMSCEDPFYRCYERTLRMFLFQHSIGDDYILEPWLTIGAEVSGQFRNLWGVSENKHSSNVDGGSWKYAPPLKDWEDMAKLQPVTHYIDEEKTRKKYERLQEAIGDIIEINLQKGPIYLGFMADISTSLAGLRGLEQIMIDMYESPEELHKLLAFMRNTILREQKKAEDQGDWSLTTQGNQSMIYVSNLKPPQANVNNCKRQELWTHCAAQEFTLISPKMHDEFLLQYQMPVLENFALVSYGCCENLTGKIDILRQIPNLRQIAVAPTADVKKCAEQIGSDYVISWRPNPTDMVCGKFNEAKIRTIIGEGLDALRGTNFHICLKDVETVEDEPERLGKWTAIVKDEIDKRSFN